MYKYGAEEADNVKRIIDSGSWFRYYGTEQHCQAVSELEGKFKKITGAGHVLAVSSGTASLITALRALGIGVQSEVIVPAYTFIASANAVVAAGAVPVMAEVDETLTIDVADIEKRITSRTRAIMPVHMLGFPCDMDAIMELAKKHNLLVVEDAAQAVGAGYKGKVLGTIGDVGCYSLQWHKIISTGEGGVFLTNDKRTYDRAALSHDGGQGFRNLGIDEPSFPGVNYRMSEVAGALGCAQADRLGTILVGLREAKKKVVARLTDLKGFKVLPSHDAEGDAGTLIGIIAPDKERAKRFSAATEVPAIFENESTNWHIYSYWDCIMQKRSADGTGFPWKILDWESPVQYAEDMCPNTLDILARTFIFWTAMDMGDSAVDEMATTIQKGVEV